MAETHEERYARLLPNGEPHYVRVYDNYHYRRRHRFSLGGNSSAADRYTVVFTGRYPGKATGGCLYLIGSDATPTAGGIRRIMENDDWIIDRSGHSLGERIPYFRLPEHLRIAVSHEYRLIWGLTERDETTSIAEWQAPNYFARLESRGR